MYKFHYTVIEEVEKVVEIQVIDNIDAALARLRAERVIEGGPNHRVDRYLVIDEHVRDRYIANYKDVTDVGDFNESPA